MFHTLQCKLFSLSCDYWRIELALLCPHLPHAFMEGTNMPCLPPLPLTISVLYSSLFEGEVHICAGETNEADRIND